LRVAEAIFKKRMIYPKKIGSNTKISEKDLDRVPAKKKLEVNRNPQYYI
jgi:hypothetical protein